MGWATGRQGPPGVPTRPRRGRPSGSGRWWRGFWPTRTPSAGRSAGRPLVGSLWGSSHPRCSRRPPTTCACCSGWPTSAPRCWRRRSGGGSRPRRARPWPDGATRVAQRLVGLEDWAQALPDLVGYWRVVGCGLWGQFVAFRWEGEGRGLQPVRALDPTRLEDLVGYETARQAVVENTERLVAGRPAHHLLLYGPRGTGKSATVRALVHTFGPRGLRLVELPLDRVGELPQLLNQLRDQPHPIVILLDDLALEPDDPAARQLKVALE